jgi:AcrR family transcriptional regulator
MAATLPMSLKARKQPRQARSQVTVEAIFDAAIQVLLAEGSDRLTTIRVADRAGVSVGTLYQYYPNKQALLLDVLQRHLARIGDAVALAATSVHGMPLATMVPVVIDAFVRAKTANMDEARSLFAIATQLDSRDILRAAEKRGRAIFAAMLATAPDVRFDDMATVSYMFFAAMVGPTRHIVDGNAPQKIMKGLRAHLVSLCLGYLEREARPG